MSSALLKMETYTDGSFRISFDAACQRTVLEDLLDHCARDFSRQFMGECNSKWIMKALHQYFYQRFSDELSSQCFFDRKERIVRYLLGHLEESIEVMGLLPWIKGRMTFWSFVHDSVHHNRRMSREKMLCHLDGFLLSRDIEYLVSLDLLPPEECHRLRWDLFDKRTHPMGWSRKELLLSECLFSPETILLNRLHIVRLREGIHLRVWYLRDGKTGDYLQKQVAVDLSDEKLKDFVIGVVSDILPQMHFQTLGYCEWEHIVTVLLKTVLFEALQEASVPKDMSIACERLRCTINQLACRFVSKMKWWIELLILANGFLSSCCMAQKPLDLTTLAQLVSGHAVFQGEVETAGQSVLLIWCLRSRPVSLYQAACARAQVEEIIKNGEWLRALKA
ncbi:hypothetical protein [Candidatus Similichlamydia laticola]|uniref:hypothetical protein n=1 Tax=Candidatus Similichlamydia laticola TaxID=2170265 RepID=UPI0011C05D70|nr:hypothetical protein [Candidatus Similichlamydia laticola]